MIFREGGRVVMECDACGERHEGDCADDACPAFFDAFIETTKANGWETKPLGADIVNTCPECS